MSVPPKSDHSEACSNTFRNAATVLGDTDDSADNNTLGSGIRRALTKPPVDPTKIARQRDTLCTMCLCTARFWSGTKGLRLS
jgi:hypothetical protein